MRMTYLWYAFKSIIAKLYNFFADILIYVFVVTGTGLFLIFIGIVIFVIRRKQKQAHAMTNMQDNSSLNFSKKFFTICKKNL